MNGLCAYTKVKLKASIDVVRYMPYLCPKILSLRHKNIKSCPINNRNSYIEDRLF